MKYILKKSLFFKERVPFFFQISFEVSSIIDWMSSSNYGSLAMNDFRRQQFVLVNGSLKLSDVDDLGFGDPICDKDEDCALHFSSSNRTQM